MTKRILIIGTIVIVIITICIIGCVEEKEEGKQKEFGNMKLSSSAFENEEAIPSGSSG